MEDMKSNGEALETKFGRIRLFTAEHLAYEYYLDMTDIPTIQSVMAHRGFPVPSFMELTKSIQVM
jgi:hypothetical protein